MSSPEAGFPLFPQLPLELREEIWRFCLPNRVHELDRPLAENVYDVDEDHPAPCHLQRTSLVNGYPPLISRVCRESRAVAHETGRFLPLDQQDQIVEGEWYSDTLRHDAWRDAARDSVHLNWTRAYEVDFYYTEGDGSPLEYLAKQVSLTKSDGSMMAQYLDANFGPDYTEVSTSVYHPQNPNKERESEALKQQSSWLVVTRVIVVHSDLQSAAATGLFGLLGDSLVQIVDCSNGARIRQYLDLAESCEQHHQVAIRQNPRQEPLNEAEQRLKWLVKRTQGSEELLSAVRPGIMFRLCTQQCNRRV
ncbi:hypothetical protein LTR56_017175 [Elasticomyces elasticus]|nr:hypothetical protein LTR56_017175 [Elasticomyces elasticus]KAK3666291.1 hypothetical protein LTR22_002955 [Elasticomyces elasticus]KAK4926887.1 hypothetical protein LTR49_006303 [Elasticomyces elasticus]KAK5752682.1 hypothetical protein LTS12_017251 [Elasticomyces elasticus]